MKKMIFIVICLALSGCVQKGVLFGELVDDEWVWFKNGDEKTDSKYDGEIRKGVPNGKGTLISPDGKKHVVEFKDGMVQTLIAEKSIRVKELTNIE